MAQPAAYSHPAPSRHHHPQVHRRGWVRPRALERALLLLLRAAFAHAPRDHECACVPGSFAGASRGRRGGQKRPLLSTSFCSCLHFARSEAGGVWGWPRRGPGAMHPACKRGARWASLGSGPMGCSWWVRARFGRCGVRRCVNGTPAHACAVWLVGMTDGLVSVHNSHVSASPIGAPVSWKCPVVQSTAGAAQNSQIEEWPLDGVSRSD